MHSLRLPSVFTALLLSLAVACGGDDSGNDGSGDDDGGPISDGDFDNDGIPDNEDDDDDGDGVPDDQDDCPLDNDPCDDTSDAACKHLDVVIAVDASSSMDEEMAAMQDEIFGGPNGFANALLDISGGVEDYRVGTHSACPSPPVFSTTGEPDGPNDQDNGTINCDFASGKSWIEGDQSRDADEVISEFECVGRIDRVENPTNGVTAGDCDGDSDDEQPASAAIAALAPDANPGFLRNDAVLVVVALTDEDEQPDDGASAAELYDALVARKGNVNNMVFLGIGGGSSCSGVYGTADDAQKLHNLTNLFIDQERGVWHDLCVGRLGDGLSAAIDVIENACDDFNPVD